MSPSVVPEPCPLDTELRLEPGGGRAAESGADAGPAPSAEVTQLHGNGAGGDAARTPPS